MTKAKAAIVMFCVAFIVFLPFEIGLFSWLIGNATFTQAFFASLLSYALIALVAYLWRNPFILVLGLLFRSN